MNLRQRNMSRKSVESGGVHGKRSKNITLAFVEMINKHDPEGLARLMTKDHVFTDSLGRSFRGREEMKDGWKQYFRLFPDYKISIIDIFEKGSSLALLGTAQGSYLDEVSKIRNNWKVPAAWKVIVSDGLISEWHVFADNYQTMKLVSGSR